MYSCDYTKARTVSLSFYKFTLRNNGKQSAFPIVNTPKLNLCSELVVVKPMLLLNNIGNDITSNNFLIDLCSLVLTISARNWFLSEWEQPCERKVKREVEEEESIIFMVQRCPRTCTWISTLLTVYERKSGECYAMDFIRSASAFRPAAIKQLD